MKVFTNKEIKIFFAFLCCTLGVFTCLIQLSIWLAYGTLNLFILLLSLLAASLILGASFVYFYKQNQRMDYAVSQINAYLAGNTDARIECNSEGGLYKLFHAINTLATALNAQAVKEQKVKEFLKGTISDISHQLKTPLAALNIYNGLLQQETDDIAAMHTFAQKAEKEIDRIEVLVQNLLKITKLDAGTIVIKKAPERIANMMGAIQEQFEWRAHAEQKTIALSGADTAELFCDRSWMTEAVGNLVKNALDHTSAKSEIAIQWKQLPAVTQITIKDNGSGIHPEDIHHIFKRFYRSRFSQDTQGIGLGLPLSKAIVEAHGGTLTVDSVLGKGTRFILSFINLTKL